MNIKKVIAGSLVGILGVSAFAYAILSANTKQVVEDLESAYIRGKEDRLEDIYYNYLDNKALYLNDEVEGVYSYYSYMLEKEKEEKEKVDEKNSYKDYVILNIDYEIKGDYNYITFTVDNIGNNTAEYLEFEITFFDASGKVVNTTMTNWSGYLREGRRCIVSTMERRYGSEESVSISLVNKRD